MARGAGSTVTNEHLCVTAHGTDPRSTTLLRAAHDLGIGGVRMIAISDLVVIRGELTDADRGVLADLLVDPLLEAGAWNAVADGPGRVVETALHPGVTDAATDQLSRLAERMGLPISGVAGGTRFVIEGAVSDDDLDRLIAALLANPIIERFSIDTPIEPAFVDPTAVAAAAVDIVEITGASTADDLALINRERGLALDPAELIAVRDHFVSQGRSPSDVELEMIAQTWSEHCAHKTFRALIVTPDGISRPSLIDRLRRTTEMIDAPFVRSAFVGNAGIIGFTSGRTIALKCETHNHPSAIEPFGGANTGIGGVIRDIIGAAHRPIACTDILCFGDPDTDPLTLPDGVFPPRRTRSGVVDGIADYGNKIGLPTVAGAVLYDPGYTANPLVYAGCIGVSDTYVDQVPPQQGDRVIVLGGRTGRDGLRGATFSSMTMDASTGDVSGASVQIGDPITEKLLIDLLRDAGHLYRSITDCGAGGLSSAIGEMAETVGADVDLAQVRLKYPGLTPWEIWLSEAQERMVLAVDPQRCAALQELCDLHSVEYTDVGSFTGDRQLVVRYDSVVVAHLDTGFLHDGRPQRVMDAEPPTPEHTPLTAAPSWLTRQSPLDVLLALLGHPNIASKADIIHRYDHEIRGATAVRPLVGAAGDGHGDGVVVAEPTDEFGIAIGIGVNPWFGVLDPQRMALAAIDEAIRNVVCVGADPDRVALLDNFSWGDPRRASTLGELAAAVDGCCDGALVFGAPFVSGKDSLNNEYLGSDGERHSVPPTLVITAIAHVPDVERCVTADLKQAGNVLLLTGTTTAEFGASHAGVVCGRPLSDPDAGPVPAFDTSAPVRYRALHTAIGRGLIRSAHDCAEGGLAVAVAEMSIGGRLGVTMTMPVTMPVSASGRAVAPSTGPQSDLFTHLFSESLGRIVIEVESGDVDAVRSIIGDCAEIGRVTADTLLTLPDGIAVSIDTLLGAWQAEQ